MAIRVVPYTDEWVPAVAEFNARLAAASCHHTFPETTTPTWLPKLEVDRRPYQEYYIAVEGAAVRGGYILKWQDFIVRGQVQPVAGVRWPLSEGVINKDYAGVWLSLIGDALNRHPLLFLLGMGGVEERIPKMLRMMRWSVCEVPFQFFINRPARVLRQIPALRTRPLRRLALDLAAATGLGWLGIKALSTGGRLARSRLSNANLPRVPDLAVEVCSEFGPWCDHVWEQCTPHYSIAAVRDCRTLNLLYPPADQRLLRIRLNDGRNSIGWGALLDTQMHEHPHFGSLRVGTLVDGVCLPEYLEASVQTLTRTLTRRGVDLVISNQLHEDWGAAQRQAGYLAGPSNFAVAVSPELAAHLDPFESTRRSWLLNRGDGDGPMDL